MSVSAISSSQTATPQDNASTLPPALQALANQYNALGASLDSNDLAGAQQAFAALVQSVPAAPPPTDASPASSDASSPPSDPSVGSDLVSLGQALQSGDLSGAQAAFAKLQQAVQAADPTATDKPRGHHRHHGHHGGGRFKTDATAPAATVSANPLDPSNAGQGDALLQAQEQANGTTS